MCLLELFNKINVGEIGGLTHTYYTFEGHSVTSPDVVRVCFEAGVLSTGFPS